MFGNVGNTDLISAIPSLGPMFISVSFIIQHYLQGENFTVNCKAYTILRESEHLINFRCGLKHLKLIM